MLGLHAHVEGGGRLVEDDHLGLEHEGAGDRDALPLAARQADGATRRATASAARPSTSLGSTTAARSARVPTP